ncbi:hypothetical protein, partial [Bacillus alveayuensis]|uniref:hypothetical protein n=1 Tax=Aeribacillus alveayuensis TaxID=279215 RepID=UPI001F2AF56D
YSFSIVIGKRHTCYVTYKRDVNRTKVDGQTTVICPTTSFVRLIDSRKATKFTKTAIFKNNRWLFL